MRKEELRRLMRHQKRQFSQQQLEELSLAVIQRLKPHLANVKVVLAYYSLPDEVCTHRFIDDLVAEGKTVLLPRVIDGQQMQLRLYSGLGDLREGAFHIMEPTGALFVDYQQIGVALIPGMAFDAEGHRLGRGKGYYDRFLPSLGGVRKLGVCFDFQKVQEVPVDAYDVAVDEVV